MRTIIIEDEKPAAEKLHQALLKCAPGIQVLAILASVKGAVEWLNQHSSPELIFMDIELTDGLSFKIFEQTNVNCPIIFTTAYDEYWQEAFEHNSLDYLLKPVKQEKLEASLKKYEKLKQHFAFNYKQLTHRQQTGEHKKRFLVKRGTDYISIKAADVAYFYAAQKLVCLVDSNAQKFILDQSLADLEKQLDPAQFYRVNRKYLVNLNAIKKIKSYPKSKLLLEIQPPPSEEVIVSQESSGEFKKWMEG